MTGRIACTCLRKGGYNNDNWVGGMNSIRSEIRDSNRANLQAKAVIRIGLLADRASFVVDSYEFFRKHEFQGKFLMQTTGERKWGLITIANVGQSQQWTSLVCISSVTKASITFLPLHDSKRRRYKTIQASCDHGEFFILFIVLHYPLKLLIPEPQPLTSISFTSPPVEPHIGFWHSYQQWWRIEVSTCS